MKETTAFKYGRELSDLVDGIVDPVERQAAMDTVRGIVVGVRGLSKVNSKVQLCMFKIIGYLMKEAGMAKVFKTDSTKVEEELQRGMSEGMRTLIQEAIQ